LVLLDESLSEVFSFCDDWSVEIKFHRWQSYAVNPSFPINLGKNSRCLSWVVFKKILSEELLELSIINALEAEMDKVST